MRDAAHMSHACRLIHTFLWLPWSTDLPADGAPSILDTPPSAISPGCSHRGKTCTTLQCVIYMYINHLDTPSSAISPGCSHRSKTCTTLQCVIYMYINHLDTPSSAISPGCSHHSKTCTTLKRELYIKYNNVKHSIPAHPHLSMMPIMTFTIISCFIFNFDLENQWCLFSIGDKRVKFDQNLFNSLLSTLFISLFLYLLSKILTLKTKFSISIHRW